MNKKVKNLILYLVLFLILFAFSFTPLFGAEELWNKKKNEPTPFHGIYFDIPTNVSNLKVIRSADIDDTETEISYDVEFEYQGADSSMRIIGTLERQAFFGEGVVPKHSKATLKGEYESINETLFNERLKLKDLYKKTKDYKFKSVSEIRVPLTESNGKYKFKITYAPRNLVYAEEKYLGNVSVFLTNARIDKFTDTKYPVKFESQSFNVTPMYVNTLELYNEKTISNINNKKNVNNVIFILSVIFMLAVIWMDKISSEFTAMGIMTLNALTFYRFMETGVSTKASVFIFPIIGIAVVLLARFMKKEKLKFNKYDLTQSLGGAIIMMILAVMVYVVPKTF